ncbi:PREDICTED: larval cuticle protein LCP-22-like [Nicrophorus vespilloides]|uniref:Larval cuticle protein LCP-22-like n=1 Tax=Nicrophorus vespilloides TaxID=110193 RepID=A0ABM1NG34_NICVS|nr:PREDICTED: larval cuticle protein LCP-22-like [Nicrophorus vespilloides]
MKTSIVVFVGLFALGSAQLFNRFNNNNNYNKGSPFARTYKPVQYTPFSFNRDNKNERSNEGQYIHNNDGQYYHDNSGDYIHQEERYRHQEDKYKHQEDKYKPYVAESRPVKKIVPAQNLYGVNPGLKKGNAAGLYDNRNYRIIRKIEDVKNNKYYFLYETENGIFAEEQGKLVTMGGKEGIQSRGYFTYTGPDSIVYTVKYKADEEGFVPEAAHLPTPPPIPEDIARALEYQRSQGTL